MESSGASASNAGLSKTLKLAGGVLAVVVSPLVAIWLDYPLALPRLDVVALEKMLLSFVWLIFIFGLYYRDKINDVHDHHFGRS